MTKIIQSSTLSTVTTGKTMYDFCHCKPKNIAFDKVNT